MREGWEAAGCELTEVLAEESGDRVERGAGGARLVVDIDDVDIATRLAVVRDEPLRLVPREIRVVVVIVMDDVGPALHPQRRRGRYLLAALEEQHWVALGHGGLGLPVGVVLFLHSDGEGRRVRAFPQFLRVAVARQGVDDRP